MVDLFLFYNICGGFISILSIIMFAIPMQKNEEGQIFNLSKNCLAVLFLLTGASMFVAQFEEHLQMQQFEKLNIVMLLFFFLIGQGILFSILILYNSRYAEKRYLRRALLPVLPWFGLYTVIYFFTGDVRIYSFEEFFLRFSQEPLLVLRCIILVFMTFSIIRSIRLCHRAKEEYHQLVLSYFSETAFARSIWLSNLLGGAKALSIWVVLTYFYTTPVLEVIVGCLISVVYIFYVKEFYFYGRRTEELRAAVLFSGRVLPWRQPVVYASVSQSKAGIPESFTEKGEQIRKPDIISPSRIVSNEATEDDICFELLNRWVERADKPFTKPGLTIADVVNDISVPRNILSNYINRGQMNFSTWVKVLRIEEASRLLIEQPDLPLSEIALSMGFSNFSAFSRAFKKIKRVTPAEYRNVHTGASV